MTRAPSAEDPVMDPRLARLLGNGERVRCPATASHALWAHPAQGAGGGERLGNLLRGERCGTGLPRTARAHVRRGRRPRRGTSGAQTWAARRHGPSPRRMFGTRSHRWNPLGRLATRPDLMGVGARHAPAGLGVLLRQLQGLQLRPSRNDIHRLVQGPHPRGVARVQRLHPAARLPRATDTPA